MARETVPPAQFYKAFKSRLLALSHAHDLLSRGAWQDASLRDLLQQMLAPYAQGDEHRIVLAGPGVRLSPNAALALAMAFHELATNAAKYGALSAPGGRIAVTWAAESSGARALDIRWVERGGPAVVPPSRRGFGSRLIERGLAHELEAELRLQFVPPGLDCLVRLPLTHKVRLA
jgi:two-component sensor histidine kinase